LGLGLGVDPVEKVAHLARVAGEDDDLVRVRVRVRVGARVRARARVRVGGRRRRPSCRGSDGEI
jgi:hypothetical protein